VEHRPLFPHSPSAHHIAALIAAQSNSTFAAPTNVLLTPKLIVAAANAY